MSFGSGSSGNCSYIGDSQNGFLIDAGVEIAKVIESLSPQRHLDGQGQRDMPHA